jgi:A1 cistron-splicing factor AAR2
MAQSNQLGDPVSSDTHGIPALKMEDDAHSEAIPIHAANATKTHDPASVMDPTFMQNQISIQRSPSTAHLQASALSRKLSLKSNGSSDHATNYPPPAGTRQDNDGQERHGHERQDSDSSIIDATNACSLSKSPSTSTTRSARSTRSVKSVHSVHAVGNYPLGSLRVHSPSPSRTPSETHECLKSGDVIVIRDIPAGSLFGYDTRSFTVPENDSFQGIKAIPSGAHFIWGSSASNTSRTGFWIMSAKRSSAEYGEIHVKRWNSYDECLSEEVSAAEVRIQKGCVPEILDKLQGYSITNPSNSKSGSTSLDFSNIKQLYAKEPNIWTHLTSSMKGALLTKVTGHQWNHWQVSSSDDYKHPREPSLPDDPMDFRSEEVLRFVFPQSTRTFSDEALGRDRTEQAMDTTAHIKSIITTHCTFEDQDEIIGEMQFCYITGMILGNLACMEQWGHIVKVLFRAFKLVLELPVFVRKVIEAFHAQLIYDEEGLDSSILDHDASLSDELKKLLTIFKSRLTELLLDQGNQLTDDQKAVGQAFEELESWLWKWGWDLRSNYVRSGKVQLEDGEIVDMELADFEDEDERGKVNTHLQRACC